LGVGISVFIAAKVILKNNNIQGIILKSPDEVKTISVTIVHLYNLITIGGMNITCTFLLKLEFMLIAVCIFCITLPVKAQTTDTLTAALQKSNT